MFTRLPVLIALFAALVSLRATAQTPADEQEVLKVHQARLAAALAQDVAALELKRDGRWQLTDFQASNIAAARPAAGPRADDSS